MPIFGYGETPSARLKMGRMIELEADLLNKKEKENNIPQYGIVFVAIQKGLKSYLDWIGENITKKPYIFTQPFSEEILKI